MTDVRESDDQGAGDGAAGAAEATGAAPVRRYDRWRAAVAGGYSPAARARGAVPLPPPPPAAPTPAEQRRSLLTLGAVLAVIVGAGAGLHALGVVVTIALIATVIMLHELGHFTAAKLGGMKVTEYFLGFGPRVWSVRRGETTYGVKAIPGGGYVRILGMNNLEQVDPADEARTYRQASFWRRFSVAVAGSTVHFVLAIATVWALFSFGGQARLTPGIQQISTSVGPTPAAVAGLRAGDRFVSYDGHAVHSWEPLHAYIRSHVGVPITLVVRRRGTELTVRVTPADGSTYVDETGTPFSKDHAGILGISPTSGNYSLAAAAPHALRTFWNSGVIGTFQGVGHIFSPAGLTNIGHQVTATPGATPATSAGNRPVSIIGIVQIAGQLHGWPDKALLFFEANAFVGVINLFPLLPFDGGHVVIAVYEAVRSRRGRRYRADVNKMVPYAMAVMVLLAFVFVSSVYLDVAHPISLH